MIYMYFLFPVKNPLEPRYDLLRFGGIDRYFKLSHFVWNVVCTLLVIIHFEIYI